MQDLTKFGFNFGLERITELLRRVNNPHLGLKVIHIGGTNGKGSVSAMVSSILQQKGFRVGAFNSPHLHSYTERYRINEKEIEPLIMASLITELRPHLDAMVKEGYEHPTEFEVSTALAFLYFNRQNVDYLVLEVGLGGLIDSTNVIIPLVSVITNISMDHMDYLGNTIAEIAKVKAGIIKENIVLVTAAKGEALEIFKAICQEKNSPIFEVGKDIIWQEKEWSFSNQKIKVRGFGKEYEVDIPLKGRHQQINAVTAIAVVEVLNKQGLGISPEMIKKGISLVKWPARMEVMQENPLVIIDGAHNLDGAIALGKSLDDYALGKDIIMVFGMLGDKEREKVVARLAIRAKAIIVTKPNSNRAGDWESLAKEALKFVSEVEIIENIHQAVQRALNIAKENDLICITGSLYMVAEAREFFYK